MAGPAALAAAVPVSTKMPVPMIAPMPSRVRSMAVSVRFNAFAVLDISDQLLDRFCLEEIRIHSPSVKGRRIRDPIRTLALQRSRAYGNDRPTPLGRWQKRGDYTLNGRAGRWRTKVRTRTSISPRSPEGSKSVMIATADAPAEITELAFASVIPPIATTGFPRPAAAATSSSPRASYRSASSTSRRSDRQRCSWRQFGARDRSVRACASRARRSRQVRRSLAPRRRRILLSHMHAVGVRKPGDVRPVVDDDPATSLVRDGDHTFGQIQEGSAFAGLVAQLQKSRAATKVCVGDCEWIEACT